MGGKSLNAQPPAYGPAALEGTTMPLPKDLVTLRINAVAVINSEEGRAVALRILEDTARDLQLKLLLLADSLPGVSIEHKHGSNSALICKSLSGDSLSAWIEQEQSR